LHVSSPEVLFDSGFLEWVVNLGVVPFVVMGVDVEAMLVSRSVVDIDAFERLYRAEHARLVKVALAFLRDREAAMDAVQEAFLRVYRHWGDDRVLDRPEAWVRRVLVNECIDRTRRSRREAQVNSRVEAMPRSVSASQMVDTTAQVFQAAAALPSLQLACVVLHYVDQQSIDEVAEVLGVRPGTVKSSLFRARRRLVRMLEEDR
jgi:RNA polymerase sigma-70 factor (ECF subfamily)